MAPAPSTRPATADAPLVRGLRGAGAVILGKTNLPELAICGFTESKTWGVTRNPWDPGRTCGGSSGGSGAAVAAGLAAGASASDGAGSIRIPAACCGLFGLKPQRGRLPIEPAEHWHGMSVNGCLTRTVMDSALFLDLTMLRSGEAGAPEPPSRPLVEAARTPPGRLRIAISAKPVRAVAPPIVSDEVKNALRRSRGAVARPRSRGASPRPRLRPGRQQRRPALPARDPRGRRSGSQPRAARKAHSRLRPLGRALSRGRGSPGAAARRARRGEDQPQLVGVRRPDHPDDRRAAGRDRALGFTWRPANPARDEPHLLLHRDLEPHRPAGRLGADGPDRRRPAARRPAHRPAERRADAGLARRPDRGRATVGGHRARRSS